MTKLLVSVRNLREARIALSEGCDILDIKEPNKGSLGAASSEVIDEIVAFAGGKVPMSAALGELSELAAFTCSPSLSYAKIGLANCRSKDWLGELNQVWGSLPPNVHPVAVAYADFDRCDAPSLTAIASLAANTKDCKHLLIDTYYKDVSAPDLLAKCPQLSNEFTEARRLCIAEGIQIVLAGSLRLTDIPQVVNQWCPDFVAIRGALCDGERTETISAAKLREWQTVLL